MPKTDTDRELYTVVNEVWFRGGLTLSCDFVRKHAAFVAMAASQHLISTRIDKTQYGHIWRITNKGLRWLNEQKA